MCKTRLYLKTFALPRTKQRFVCLVFIKLLLLRLPIYSESKYFSSVSFNSPSSRHSLYIDFVSPYLILPYARTKELVSMLNSLHGTRMEQLLRATNCPYRAKHVTNAVRVIELMTPSSTNTCLLESYKMTNFIFVVFLKSPTG
jgi:hypothetical protein